MLLVHKSQLFVGETVEFSYHGTKRYGVVKTISPKSFCIALKFCDKFKAFCWDKIDGREDGPCGHFEFGHTGIRIVK